MVPFIRVPIGSSSSVCYNERRVYEIGMERVFALERNSKVSLQTVSLLGLFFPKQGQSIYQLSALLAFGLSSGTKWLSRNTTECNLWLRLMSHSPLFFFFSCYALEFSPALPHPPLFCFLYWSFPAARLLSPPKQPHGFSLSLLQFSSLDSPWITWEKEPLCLLLLSIIASATPTTGFICWRRVTFDTSASQAGLPLSPAQALFLVAEGEKRVFNEIQTLGMRSHRHLKTLLPLTSVAMWGDQKTLSQAAQRNVAPLCECTMMMRNNGRFSWEPRVFEGLKYSCKCCQLLFHFRLLMAAK